MQNPRIAWISFFGILFTIVFFAADWYYSSAAFATATFLAIFILTIKIDP